MSSSIKFNGKEVKNPIARFLVVFLIVAVIFIIFVIALHFLPFIIAIVALTVPVHFILKLCGRKGFYNHSKDGTHEWILSTEAFSKQK